MNKIEKDAIALFDEISDDLDKVSLIPDKNQMNKEFFYGYAYPRLTGIIDDKEFVGKYCNNFGMHKPIQLFDEHGSKQEVVPGILGNESIEIDLDLHKQGELYQQYNNRLKGLGDLKISPLLNQAELKIDNTKNSNAWNKIHKEFLSRQEEIRPQVDESLAHSIEDVMDWG